MLKMLNPLLTSMLDQCDRHSVQSSVTQENAAAFFVELSPEEKARLEDIFAPGKVRRVMLLGCKPNVPSNCASHNCKLLRCAYPHRLTISKYGDLTTMPCCAGGWRKVQSARLGHHDV